MQGGQHTRVSHNDPGSTAARRHCLLRYWLRCTGWGILYLQLYVCILQENDRSDFDGEIYGRNKGERKYWRLILSACLYSLYRSRDQIRSPTLIAYILCFFRKSHRSIPFYKEPRYPCAPTPSNVNVVPAPPARVVHITHNIPTVITPIRRTHIDTADIRNVEIQIYLSVL
ncbi:hypothetical protein L211DRAFT_407760 [Terfezia boudieri ATCC MYA-4762]|uniref:Uncharacterized protein n=1 Tax=Terfezia boudieri ATCC MYA-4762 TaxID=1051890 RepID=A0A3N4LG21_9PEZI|nr:hypothetical protein L211DRAFT_407760 [Terfezia boudieri ATCC MYA-4762]